ncbi:MAG: hypothetical protein Q9219_000670 [cf. Caloplaca sp. 3 TL-2023]
MADFHVAHRMHTYTVIPRVLYIRRWGLKRWSLAFGKSGRKTIYKHFCAGETSSEVQETVDELKRTGFKGAVIAYAKEVVLDKGATAPSSQAEGAKDVESWKNGVLKTINLASSEDYAALKFSGAGYSIIEQLVRKSKPNAIVSQAITGICDYAKSKGVPLLIDAEQHAVQDGIDQWTLDLQRKYNRDSDAIVYGTYQAYLRSTPATLAHHLSTAQQEGFTLGVKLVRGAYLATDPRHLFWATKDETDKVYDRIAESLMSKQWNDLLTHPELDLCQRPEFPTVSLVLATHNRESVQKAISIRQKQVGSGDGRINVAYAQLMGMSDEVSCELIQAGRRPPGRWEDRTERPQAYKYVVWGTVGECLKYLLRRAEENRDALGRAKEGRFALGKELRRRMLQLFHS